MAWTRRRLLFAGGAASTGVLLGCGGGDMGRYDQAARAIRVALPTEPSLRDFVRFATLAPNSHNTQPWKFRLGTDAIDVLPDFSRRTPVVDPDDHHIYVTLGCAAENALIAGNASGRPAEASVIAEGANGVAVKVSLGRGGQTDTELSNAIPSRQSTRSDYDGQQISVDDLRRLEQAAALPGVETLLIMDRSRLERALEFIVEGNSAQVDDPAFVQELKDWLRFNADSALRSGDGLFSKCSGNPTMPTWLGNFMFDRVFTKDAENARYTSQLRSSAGLAVFVADAEGQEGWIQAGRSFERFTLQATVLGIRHAHLNMPIEVPGVRPAFADWLGLTGRRPDLIVRFGRAPPMPLSMRRSLDEVIVP
jgi:hypothetical protein